ncbi:hypothetical protein [Cystobacter fuscus]|uniref:hypothetical protein n=1 Tax=Cystobacter fuscus TaxID=43 RepID=UPI00097153A4|nr:hypothetical protein [Cystobacter fuscus]
MRRLLCVVALCTLGLTACGTNDAAEESEVLGSTQQGLACEYGTGACPSTTTCAWLPNSPGEGLCRPRCVNGACPSSSQICCTQPNGAPYCNSFCY